MTNNLDGVVNFGGADARIINSTVVDNVDTGLANIYEGWDYMEISNSIVWRNGDNTEADQLAGQGEYFVEYSLIDAWTGNMDGEKVFDADPRFAKDQYHLSPRSPCISGRDRLL